MLEYKGEIAKLSFYLWTDEYIGTSSIVLSIN